MMKLRLVFALIAVFAFGVGTAFADKININSVTDQELKGAIPGIGPMRAKAIVEYRKAHGDFKVIEDLRHVHGIGPKLLEVIRPHITFGASSTSMMMPQSNNQTGNTSTQPVSQPVRTGSKP